MSSAKQSSVELGTKLGVKVTSVAIIRQVVGILAIHLSRLESREEVSSYGKTKPDWLFIRAVLRIVY